MAYMHNRGAGGVPGNTRPAPLCMWVHGTALRAGATGAQNGMGAPHGVHGVNGSAPVNRVTHQSTARLLRGTACDVAHKCVHNADKIVPR